MVYDFIFFFKQKTAYEMRISDWSSDVCSSDLVSGRSVSRARGAAARSGASLVARKGYSLFQPHAADFGRAGAAAQGASADRPDASQSAGGIRRPCRGQDGAAIGRESCRDRVVQHLVISGVAGSLKKK